MLHILGRLTYYVSRESGVDISFDQFVNRKVRDSYDIEHVWSNHYEQDNHRQEFSTARDFEDYRNMFGGMLLLPKSINRSLQDAAYTEKKFKYAQQNILAKSFHEDCYRNEPGFLHFIHDSGLPFKPYPAFNKSDLTERQSLYRQIAERIWDLKNMERCLYS